MQIGYNVQSLKADVLSVSPLSEQLEEWWVVCGFICRKWSYTIGGSLVGIWWQENKTKLVEWKALIDTMRIKSADLEDKFLFLCFMAFQTA